MIIPKSSKNISNKLIFTQLMFHQLWTSSEILFCLFKKFGSLIGTGLDLADCVFCKKTKKNDGKLNIIQ